MFATEGSGNYQNLKWLVLLAVAVTAFYWRILFTMQFSIVEDWEAVNQGFVWHQFATRAFQEGSLPIWDPYTFSGRSHIGEMQPGLFYPLKLLLYLWPLGESGILSWRLWNQYFALAHLLGAIFMFLFALEAGIQKRFAALVAGLCFALGGFLGNVAGHQLWDSAIWLPLVFLFLLRALRAERQSRMILHCCAAGLTLAMPLLAGGLHSAIMDTIVVVTAAAFLTWQREDAPISGSGWWRYRRAATVVLIVGMVTFAAAAIQLLPSIEYAPHVLRWGAGGTALEKIRYQALTESHYEPPRAILAFLFAGAPVSPAEVSPYFGVLPMLLAILGAWHYWRLPLVKYAAGLGVLAFVYSLGPFSFLHGLLYLFPILDAAREAGRFIYLTHFAMALLAGFGAQALFESEASSNPRLRMLVRVIGCVAVFFLLVLLVPAIYEKPAVNEWHYFSLLMLLASWGLLTYISRGNRNRVAPFLVAALILWDLYSFNWVVRNRMAVEKAGNDYFEQLMAARPLAEFFHSQPGMFRVQTEGGPPVYINLGDMFAVQTTWGQAATASIDYSALRGWKFLTGCLTNTRYRLIPDREEEGRLVFSSGRWRVYEEPQPCPRAWVVHQVTVEPSQERIRKFMREPKFDPLRSAFVGEPLETVLEEPAAEPEIVRYSHYQPDRLEAEVRASARGLLVLSEMFFPGWTATVNGKSVPIHKMDSLLRGVVVESGDNHIVMRYRPNSVFYGAILSTAAFSGTFLFGGIVWWRERRRAAR